MSFQLSPYDRMFLSANGVADASPEELVPVSRYEAALRRQAEMHAAVMAEKDEAALALVKAAQRLAAERDEARAELQQTGENLDYACETWGWLGLSAVVGWGLLLVDVVVKAGGWLWVRLSCRLRLRGGLRRWPRRSARAKR